MVSLASTPQEMIVSVQDFGIGIPSDSQERIFERFYRVSSEVEKRFPGLGIGLYIAHQIIQHHGGSTGWKVSWGKDPHSPLPCRSNAGESRTCWD